jgi:hypothetical protein
MLGGVNLRPLTDSTLIVAAVFYGVLLAVAIAATLFGIWLGFILLLSLWRYSYSVLRATAQGRRKLAAPELETLNPIGDWRLVMHFIAFPALLIVLSWVRPFGAQGFGLALNFAAALVVILIFPASAAMMGITSRLEAAFNPASLRRVIKTLGRSYYVLVAVCAGVWLAAALVPALLPAMGLVTRAIGLSFAAWAVLVTFALTGTLLRENRNDFDIAGEIETETDRLARLERLEWRKSLDLAYTSIRSNLVAEGYATLRRLSAEHHDSLEIQYWLFDNMLEWEDRRHALEIGAGLVERHVADGEMTLALELFTRCRRMSPSFTVQPAAAAALAGFARSIGRTGTADELAVGG